MSEATLATQYGVSRNVVREALRILTAKGLLRVRQGSRAVVTANLHDALVESLRLAMHQTKAGFSALMQARRALEVQIAGIAAQSATPEAIAALRECVDASDLHTSELEDFVDYDIQFHTTLARATGNSIFEVMVRPMLGLVRAGMLLSYLGHLDEEFKALGHHRRICAAVEASDVEAARMVMEEHLLGAEEDIRRAIARQNLSEDVWDIDYAKLLGQIERH